MPSVRLSFRKQESKGGWVTLNSVTTQATPVSLFICKLRLWVKSLLPLSILPHSFPFGKPGSLFPSKWKYSALCAVTDPINRNILICSGASSQLYAVRGRAPLKKWFTAPASIDEHKIGSKASEGESFQISMEYWDGSSLCLLRSAWLGLPSPHSGLSFFLCKMEQVSVRMGSVVTALDLHLAGS